MGSSRLFQFRYSYQRDLVDIHAKISFGASGAPTLVTASSGQQGTVSLAKGIVSITRNSAGKYTLVLKDNYFQLMGMQAAFVGVSGVPAAPIVNVFSEQVSNVTTPSLIIQCLDAAGAAADPDDTSSMLLHLVFMNAST